MSILMLIVNIIIMEKDTLVIFTSDIGPWNLSGGRGGSALPLRGSKFSTYEGGHRVP